jgi:hypothetical protein
MWRLHDRMREPDIKYAAKVGLGTGGNVDRSWVPSQYVLSHPFHSPAVLAAPAYLERTRSIFLEYRGEWALIAAFASLSKTVGATNL